jgi:hypothetical protein
MQAELIVEEYRKEATFSRSLTNFITDLTIFIGIKSEIKSGRKKFIPYDIGFHSALVVCE